MKRLTTIILIVFAMFLFLNNSSCDSKIEEVQKEEENKTAAVFSKLSTAVPPPVLEDSLERRQLVKRLERFNIQDKISYIYLIDYGRIMAYHVIKGKVSSVNSKLTCSQQTIWKGSGAITAVESPALDGSYGSNGDAIFFFTAADIYVEWNSKYLLCDRPMKLTQQPMMVMNVKNK